GRVLLVQPRGPVGEVDLDGLELDALLGEHDPHSRGVGTARSVVERDHGCTPITVAICSYSSWAGGSSSGDAAVRATSRTRLGSAPVSRPTTVAFAPNEYASPGGSGPKYSGTDWYSSTSAPRSKRS